MKTNGLIVYVCLAMAVYTPVSARVTAHYTLNDLCRAANENAEQIKIAEQDVLIARQEKQRARSVLIPRATAFGSYTRYKDTGVFSPNTASAGIRLNQSFTLNGRELIAYDVAKKGIETNAYTLEALRSSYLLEVALAYFDALEAKRMLEIAQADVERLQTHKQAVEEKLRVGSVTRTDLFRAEAELSRAKSDRETAQNSVVQTRAYIVRITGIDSKFSISDTDIQAQDPIEPSLAQIQSQALANRFEIKSARKNLEITDQTIQYEKGEYWPQLNLETGYRKSDVSYGSSIMGMDTGSNNEEAYVLAELQFTLFDGGLRNAQIRQAEAKRNQANQMLNQARNDIILETRVAFSEYETAQKTLINLADELTSAQENYQAVQMQYQYGMANIVDMMDANTLLVQSERRISNARYALFQTMYRLFYTQGQLPAHVLE
ncbi:MAG: TolC family protein [Desulfotignum sp.]|nr:TolC family protein [Desulfotignum sp.]MCF8136840.1 TolC family protein [Desulfotignum sp.]